MILLKQKKRFITLDVYEVIIFTMTKLMKYMCLYKICMRMYFFHVMTTRYFVFPSFLLFAAIPWSPYMCKKLSEKYYPIDMMLSIQSLSSDIRNTYV